MASTTKESEVEIMNTDTHDELYDRQRVVACAMIRSGKSGREVLEEYGVDESEYLSWIEEGGFAAMAARLAGGFAAADAPYVWNVLLELIRGGSVPAIRLYFDMRAKKMAADPQAVPGRIDSLQSLRSAVFGDADGQN